MANNILSKLAKDHGMTRDEFIEDVMATAAALGMMVIDENKVKDKAISWMVSDSKNNENIRVTIERVK